MQRNNEGLQVMFDEVLQRKCLKQDATHQEMQGKLWDMEAVHQKMLCKLQATDKKNEGLRLMFNEARRRNKEMLKGATASNTQRDCVQASRHREKQWFAYHVWLSSQKKYTNA